jgi:uncharacterized protein (TIGR04222 family)
LYGILIILTGAWCRWLRDRTDATRSLPAPPIPERIDPYEIAYLRGGENELLRVAIVQLVALEYLRVETRKESLWKPLEMRIVQLHEGETPGLSVLERCVFDWFRSARKFDEIFQDGELFAKLRPYMCGFEEKLHSGQLLTSESDHPGLATLIGLGLVVSGGIGLLRLSAGVLHDRPVGFLIFMGIGGLALVASTRRDRLSCRGKAYLQALQEKWGSLKTSPVTSGGPVALATALFGVAVLAGTSCAALAVAFKKSASSGADGCGDGCGGCGGCGD